MSDKITEIFDLLESEMVRASSNDHELYFRSCTSAIQSYKSFSLYVFCHLIFQSLMLKKETFSSRNPAMTLVFYPTYILKEEMQANPKRKIFCDTRSKKIL